MKNPRLFRAGSVNYQIKLSRQIPSIINGILTRKIITLAAEEAGIKVTVDDLQQAADNFRLMKKFESANATLSWLQQHSLSSDEFEELVYANVIYLKLAQHLFADKLEPFFVEHQLDYAQVVIYEVVLDDFDLAMELFYALTEGEISFHEVTRQYIQENELHRQGGYRGILHRAQLEPKISAAVAAKPPQILKRILTSKGVYLILVEELIQSQLDEMLRCKIISDLFSEWLKLQIEQFGVEIN